MRKTTLRAKPGWANINKVRGVFNIFCNNVFTKMLLLKSACYYLLLALCKQVDFVNGSGHPFFFSKFSIFLSKFHPCVVFLVMRICRLCKRWRRRVVQTFPIPLLVNPPGLNGNIFLELFAQQFSFFRLLFCCSW